MGKSNKGGAYKRGLYSAALNMIRSKQVVTRSMVVKFYMDAGKSEAAAMASATVLLSPRKEDSKRGKFGNCLGNYSADGVHYFMTPLKHIKGEEKKFRFHLCTADEVTAREAISEKRGNGRKEKTEKTVKEVKQVKTSKKTVKAPAKKVVKAKAKAKAKAKKVAVVVPVADVVAPAPAVVTEPITEAPIVQ